MKIQTIHTLESASSVESAQTMPKAPQTTSGQEEEDPPDPEPDWEKVSRRRGKDKDKDKAKAKDRDLDRYDHYDRRNRHDLDHHRSKEREQPKGSPKGLTQQPPDESGINPSRTTSLGGKRSWVSDSDSDGQAHPKKTPTQS